jgi:hypothetical protein
VLPARARAWINGDEAAIDISAGQTHGRIPARLSRGPNSILLEVVRPEGGPIGLYAVLSRSEEPPEEDRYLPRLRWFRELQQVVYDITPDRTERTGWYRFKAPPGLTAMHLSAKGRITQAWVDGQTVTVGGDRIVLSDTLAHPSQVALRVEQEPGTYAGAVFAEPVTFECETGEIPLGDWSAHGLSTYSGIGVYSQSLRLTPAHLEGKVILDLSNARSVAEVVVNDKPAGVGLARPFRFDITRLVRKGDNRIDIKVANTLANHMSTYPTPWVMEGQTISGLLGPVTVSFHAPVTLAGKSV